MNSYEHIAIRADIDAYNPTRTCMDVLQRCNKFGLNISIATKDRATRITWDSDSWDSFFSFQYKSQQKRDCVYIYIYTQKMTLYSLKPLVF